MSDLQMLPYTHDGVNFSGRLARPAAAGLRPGVLVMHNAIGMGSLVKRKALELASVGYVALAADMYGDELHSDDPDAYIKIFGALQERPDRLRERVVAAYAALCSLPDVDPQRIGAIGYCFGGQCVLELARSGASLRAAVSFHGLLTTHKPAERNAVQAKILALTGALDPYVPASDVLNFQNEMTAAAVDWQLTTYGTGWHAFTDREVGHRSDIPGVRYDPLLDRLSWAAATEFLSATVND